MITLEPTLKPPIVDVGGFVQVEKESCCCKEEGGGRRVVAKRVEEERAPLPSPLNAIQLSE
jgi:hypothetical protein